MPWDAQTMANELWEMLGEPTDVDPSTGPGLVKLLRWLNEGQRRISSWKFTDGRLIRFPVLYDRTFFKIQPKVTGVGGGLNLVAPSDSYTVQFQLADPLIPAVDDALNEWVIEITAGTGSGQLRLIVDFNGASRSGSIQTPWGTDPDGTSEYRLTKRFMKICTASDPVAGDNLPLDPVGGFQDVLKIEDVTSLVEIPHQTRTESFLTSLTSVGNPTGWFLYGNYVTFDQAPSSIIWYRMEYYRVPRAMLVAGDFPELPDTWHEGMLLWARWWGFARAQETAMSYSAKKDFEEFMARNRQSLEMRYERLDGAVLVEV